MPSKFIALMLLTLAVGAGCEKKPMNYLAKSAMSRW